VDDQYGVTPIHVASRGGYRLAVLRLIQGKANVNYEDQEGNTALDEVDEKRYPSLARLLIAAGAHGGDGPW
jgi:ankyrin repeat protein